MKLFLINLNLFFLGISSSLFACPTCVGKIRPESPAFFADDFYKPGQYTTRHTQEQYGTDQLKKLFNEKRGKK